MLSNSNNHNSALPLAVAADRGEPSTVPRVITVNSPTDESTCTRTSRSQSQPSVADPTPKLDGNNRSLASASSGTTATSSHVANLSLTEASDGADTSTCSRASSTSLSVPPTEAAIGAIAKGGVDAATLRKPNDVSARPPRPTSTEQQRHRRQQMLSQSIAFQHGEDATTLCSSVADDSRNDQSSLGGSASAFSGGSERDSMTNSVGFSYEEDDDGPDDGTEDGYRYDGCGLFGIDEQAEDDFEKFYDDLSIDSQGRDGLDRERSALHKEKMKQMASGLRKKVGGTRKGRGNKTTVPAVVQDVCSPTAAKARLEMAYENYLHTYKFDTVKTPTVSNKTHNIPGAEARRIDRRTKRSKRSGRVVVPDDNDDVAVATSTIPPFQINATMDSSSTGSSDGSSADVNACPMCSSKLLTQHRVFLEPVPEVPSHANVATATTMTARATKPRGHDNVSIQKCINTSSEGCLQCAEKCPDSVQPAVKNFLLNIFASSSTELKDSNVKDIVTEGLMRPTNAEKKTGGDPNKIERAHLASDNICYEERPVPPYCTECRSYIITEAIESEMREEMLANLSEWMMEANDEEDTEEDEDNGFDIASLKLQEGGNFVVDRPLRGNILVFLDDNEKDGQVARSMQEMDEQSVTTRQQENLSSPPAPMLPSYPGLHLVSSGEVQARGREVLPQPPALSSSSVCKDRGDCLAKTVEDNVSPMFASPFGPPDASVPISDTLNQAARPKKENNITEIIGGHAVAEALSIDHTPSIRTEKEEEEMIASYPTKRDIATKIIGTKLLNGYTLTHKQCSICDMPMMKREGTRLCVVCPTIKRRAKRRANEKRGEQKEIGPIVETVLNPVEAADTSNVVENANSQENGTDIPRGNEVGSDRHVVHDAYNESLVRNIPTNGEVSKLISGDTLLELIEALVPTYFDGLDEATNRLLNGWHLSSEREGCSKCGHPMVCEDNDIKPRGICISKSCAVVAANHSDSEINSQAPGTQQLNNMSYDSDDDDLFDLDDPALVALQKLACDKKDAAKEGDCKASVKQGGTKDKDSPDKMMQGDQSFGEAYNATSQKDQRHQSFEYFTFNRQGLDDVRMEEGFEPTSREGLGAEIRCDSLTSCSSLSFAGKKSHCSKKTCTTGIVTSRSESSDDTDDTMSALVEKMSKAKQRILRRLESRSASLNNDKGRTKRMTGRDDVEYDVADLIDRLTVAAKEVEELDNCIAKAQEDSALDF